MAFRLIQALFCSAALMAAAAHAADPSVSFTAPMDGAVVSSPFDVRFAVFGMEVRSAGDMTPLTGHHHLLINSGPVAKDSVIPMDDRHLHFGNGQTRTEVSLPPGKYRLTMQFGNGAHQSYGPEMSKTISITVK